MNDNVNMKEQVRPIYEALMGCLSSAPLSDKVGYLFEPSIWKKHQKYLDKLKEITNDDYGDYKLIIMSDQNWGPKISVQEYRTQVNSLIMALHGKYFKEDAQPFSGQPGVVVSQSQSQNQNVNVIIITQIQDLIDKRLYGSELEEKEKSFLQKIKDVLPSVKSAVELINLIITIAKNTGLDINQVSKAFGW